MDFLDPAVAWAAERGLLRNWAEAARTTAGLFWMAFWAFGLGYLISSLIQVFVTRERMRRTMGEAGPRTVATAAGFGLVSSSCSFAALSTARSLFAKGADIVPAMAFLLASTNLVIELGVIIAVFLSWQFVVGEYLGGVLLILITWALIRLTGPSRMIERGRERARAAQGDEEEDPPDWRKLVRSKEGWRRVAMRYAMEWSMVWKDVTIGFTVAGIIAVFVPRSFFEWLFVGSGKADPTLWELLAQTLVGPAAAFLTFIGSMGNIPLAAVLFSNGVSFAGVMAFIFSDLVVLPVLRIQAGYYGWRMALYILAVFLTAVVGATIAMHFAFATLGLLPDPSAARSVVDREFFAVDYTLFLNVAFGVIGLVFFGWKARSMGLSIDVGASGGQRLLFAFATLAFLWLLGGWLLAPGLAETAVATGARGG